MRRFGLFLTALALSTVVGVGCGADDLSPENAVANAATRTSEAGTSRISFSGALKVSDFGGKTLRFTGEGIFDYRSTLGRVRYDLSEMAKAAGLAGGDDWVADIVLLDDRFFMRLPALTANLPHSRPWIEVPIETKSGLKPSQLAQIGGANNPAELLQFLRGASEDVETVGEERVRGVETTRYGATVDFAMIVKKAPEDAQPSLSRELEQREAAGRDTTFRMEVWIDEDGLARRVHERDEEGDLRMELYDFGIEVDVEPPPSDDVMSEEAFDRLVEAES